MVNVFAVPVFFIVFRETLETSIVVSILLAFIKQQIGPTQDIVVYKKLRKQVWLATALGLAICIVVGCGLIGAFYGVGVDGWGKAEELWEGIFSLIATIIISIMGAALLRISKMQEKWRVKIAKALRAKDRSSVGKFGLKRWSEKYAMFILPFITILREGLEAVVFIGGVSLGVPASSIPVATITGLLAGCVVGYLIYKGGNFAPIQLFLIFSTCVLYLVAAGLFTRAVGYFEMNTWNHMTGGDAAEMGDGPGSYNIRQSVWHVNCCSPELNGGGGWGVFNAILGWTNSATYGTVISYNLYWLVVILAFLAMMYNEKKGHWPFMKPKRKMASEQLSSDGEVGAVGTIEKAIENTDTTLSTAVRPVEV